MESSWSRFFGFFCVIFGLFTFASSPSRAQARDSSALTGFYENSRGIPLLDLISQAQVSLDLEIYEMDDPGILEAIRGALRRGIKIHIVQEPAPVGGACRVFGDFALDGPRRRPAHGKPISRDCEAERELVREVNESGGRYVPFTKPQLCGGDNTRSCLEHGKLAVADDRVAMISSGNFNTTSLCDLQFSPRTCNRDYTYVTDEPGVVRTLQSVVEHDLVGNSYDVTSVMAPGTDRRITIGPNSLRPIVSMIQSARQSILIENQYLKEPDLNRALLDAARRGVQVQVVVASFCSFGSPRPEEARKVRAIFSEFENAGIQTRIFDKRMKVNGQNGYLHAKAIVVDGSRAWIGSVNGSVQAMELNREFGIFFEDAEQVRELETIMAGDFSNPAAETWQQSLQCEQDH